MRIKYSQDSETCISLLYGFKLELDNPNHILSAPPVNIRSHFFSSTLTHVIKCIVLLLKGLLTTPLTYE